MTNHCTPTDSLQQKPAIMRKAALAAEFSADPVLSFAECIADIGTSRASFYRSIKPALEIVTISPRRRGVRASTWAAWKAGASKPAAG